MLRVFQEDDFESVVSWHEARGARGVERGRFPPFGYIVPEVAAGFLYFTDSDVALLDGFVTNPASRLKMRYAGVTAITEALLISCRFRRKLPIAFTQKRSLSKIARKLGLQSVGYFEALTLGE